MLPHLYCSPSIFTQTTVSLPVSLDRQQPVLEPQTPETKFITFPQCTTSLGCFFPCPPPGNYQPCHSHLIRSTYLESSFFQKKNLIKKTICLFSRCSLCTWNMAHAWRSEDNVCESILFFHQVGPHYRTHVVRPGNKHLSQGSHLPSSDFNALDSVRQRMMTISSFIPYFLTAGMKAKSAYNNVSQSPPRQHSLCTLLCVKQKHVPEHSNTPHSSKGFV